MPSILQRLNDSPITLRLISTLGRALPLHLGHFLADRVADWLSRQRASKMVRAVRANQWVVRGESLGKEALDQAVHATLRHSARSLFDLYHYIQNPEATKRLVVLPPIIQQLVERPEFEGRGMMLVGLHTSNYDLILHWLCQQGMKPLVLTISDPQGGRRAEFERRKMTGMNILTASVGTLLHTARHLQQGGFVATGIDRPIPEPKACPLFFGRPAALPMHHIFLATKAHVPVRIIAAHGQPDGKIHVLASELIEMDSHPDREKGALRNAEKVLYIAETFIRQAPEQWSVPLPVWPETVELAPA
jgi:KDO2-lipid IV(A) lauroyltransferase